MAIDDFGDALWTVFERLFDPLQFWFYHFFGGEMVFSAKDIRGASLADFDKKWLADKTLALYRTTRPWEPADLTRRHWYVVHVCELYQFYHDKDKSLETLRSQVWQDIKLDWQVALKVFDGEVPCASIGLGRPFEAGDFNAYEMGALKLLHPIVTKGYVQAAAHTRAKLFGDAIAAAIEYHPSSTYVFDAADKMQYANHAACKQIQAGTEGHSELPMASKSPFVTQLAALPETGELANLPGVRSV
jgi:hypothetical protein